MKQLQLLVYLFIISVLPLQAQITITYADMPIFGKKYIYSMSNDFKSINPALTGANYTWDFKNLKDSVQYTDSIMAITTAPQMYQFIFNSLLDPKPTFCIPKSNLNNLDSLSKYQPTEVYEYYRITAQNYSYVGFGVNLKSVSVPIKYDTVDVLYNFPLSYGKADSGTSFSKLHRLLGHTFILHPIRKEKTMLMAGVL